VHWNQLYPALAAHSHHLPTQKAATQNSTASSLTSGKRGHEKKFKTFKKEL